MSDLDEGLIIVKDPDFDNTAPNAICQTFTATLDRTTGSVTVDPTDLDGGSTDNKGIVKWSLDKTTFTCDDLGDNTVVFTVEDDYGNKSSCTTTITIEAEETRFTGGSWNNGTPGPGSYARIAQNYNTGDPGRGSIEACNCRINNGRTLTIEAGDYLKTTKDIRVNGTLVVKHQGSVVQEDDNTSVTKGPNGVINVEVTTPVLDPKDFMLIGSPMDNETRESLFLSTHNVLETKPENFMPDPSVPNSFGINFADDNADHWISYPSGEIKEGVAYLFLPNGVDGSPSVDYDLTYDDGTLNMIANPYPSAISVQKFIEHNPGVSEVYFWEHTSSPNASLPGAWGNYNYSMQNISLRNASSGIAADGGTIPTDVIATGQGFIYVAEDNTAVEFTNEMRLDTGNTTLRNPEEEALIDRIWFKVVDVEKEITEATTSLVFNPIATNGYDPGYDSERIATITSLFTLESTEEGANEYAIQTREAFSNDDIIPLGFSSQVEDNIQYKISIDVIEGANITQVDVMLTDNKLGIITNLSEQDYVFSSNHGSYNERFTISFKSQTVLGDNQELLDLITLYPNPADELLKIASPDALIQSIEIYDLLGKRMEEELEEESDYVELDIDDLETAIYFVKVVTEYGTVTKKLIKK